MMTKEEWTREWTRRMEEEERMALTNFTKVDIGEVMFSIGPICGLVAGIAEHSNNPPGSWAMYLRQPNLVCLKIESIAVIVVNAYLENGFW